MMEERLSALIMPIVLMKADSHIDAVKAVAAAVLQACSESLVIEDDSHWGKWLKTGEGKTVRRASEKEYRKIKETHEYIGESSSGNAHALVLPVTDYSEMDKTVRRLQVGGTDFPRLEVPSLSDAPTIVLNGGLGMSTGKSAAQAAHAMLAWWHTLDAQQRLEWREGDRGINVVEVSSDEFLLRARQVNKITVIHDAGHTEIESGSATAFVQ